VSLGWLGLARTEVLAKLAKCWVANHYIWHNKHIITQIYLENVLSFVDLDAEIPSDGDPELHVKHRCDIAWGRFKD
jgi:hypothetical protein